MPADQPSSSRTLARTASLIRRELPQRCAVRSHAVDMHARTQRSDGGAAGGIATLRRDALTSDTVRKVVAALRTPAARAPRTAELKPLDAPEPPTQPSEAEIRERAYQIYLERGRPGDPVADWLQAERELQADYARRSAPADDD